ncbi:MAG: BamA/TamA family outer membrane protein [Ferruginibacter sp.]
MKIFLLSCLALSPFFSLAQVENDTIQNRIILVGDAGSLVNGRSTVLDAIKKKYELDKKTTIIFLGDNLYDYGLPNEYHDDYLVQRAALDSQIMIAKGKQAKVFMIPGNHDWSNGSPIGQETILRQQLYVDNAGIDNVKFYPEGGCPGPVEVPLGDNVVLVIFDSQWWIHQYDKPGIESDCPNKLPEQVLSALEEILNRNYKKLVIFACHHPFKSNGVHGGYFTLKQHIFPFTEINRKAYIPLPIIGSAYPIARSVFGTPQDLRFPAYQNMVTQFNSVLKNHPHVIRVHGHEHTLQLIQNDSLIEVISGAGCKTQRVSPGGDAKFVARSLGFAELDISNSKYVRAKFFEVDSKTDSVKTGYDEVITDFIKQPELPKEDTTIAVPIYNKLVLAPASLHYKEVHGIKKLINGTNYRKEWNTPVAYKVFDINTEKGGFKITGIGGGKQTKTLKLIDKKGREWALRTIDKDPQEAIPENLRGTFAQDIVQDLISAAHPYAPLTVPILANATGVNGASPEFFYVPDDRSFGSYRTLFAKKICMLELREANPDNDSKSSFKVFNKMRDDNQKTVDQEAVLSARLLDMLIGDYDRHFDQWKWMEADTGKGKIYVPIPKDRDQVFFNSNGFLVNVLSSRYIPVLKGFRKEFKNINRWNTVAKDFDRLFLNNINESKWTAISKRFVENLPDSVIQKAVLQLPPEIYAIRGKLITANLISRRNALEKETLKYYHFISKKVQVLGSNKNEYFHLYPVHDSVRLDVFSYTAKDTNFLLYSRVFDPKVTRELLLFGFGGDDVFKIDENIKNRIKIRIIGGRGLDSFIVKSPVKTFVYDNIKEKNVLIKGGRTKDRIDANVSANNYDIRGFKYDQVNYPKIALGYNVDDKLFVGTGFSIRKFGFRKEPYASDQKFSALAALSKKAYQFSYSGEFVNFYRNNTLVINSKLTEPALNNFFGFGNNTVIDKTKDIAFYRVRYDEAHLDLLIKKKPFDKLSISIGPTVYHYWNKFDDNKSYILSNPALVSLDSASVYKQKTYVGGIIDLEFNNLNSELFPTRGVSLTTRFTSMFPVQGSSYSLNKLEGNMTIYASLKDPTRVVTILKIGGGHIFNDKFEYFQAMTIGADNNLRGFRKTRFSGQSSAYSSLEFRIKVLNGKSYILPGQVGLIAFGDAGKVWYNGANSNKIHTAYGGGLYFVPFNMVIVSAAMAFSTEERLFNFSLGTKLNFTF